MTVQKCKVFGCNYPAEIEADKESESKLQYVETGRTVWGGDLEYSITVLYPTKLVNGKCRFHNMDLYGGE